MERQHPIGTPTVLGRSTRVTEDPQVGGVLVLPAGWMDTAAGDCHVEGGHCGQHPGRRRIT